MGRGGDERHGTRRQAGIGQRRLQCSGDDRLGGGEGIGTDAQHRRVAGADHTGRIGQHIGPSLEHEGDDAERSATHLHRPAVVRHRPHHVVTATGPVPPHPQTGDHAGPHRVVEDETRRRPASAPGPLDIGSIGRGDRGEHGIVGDEGREPFEEVVDLGVGALGERCHRRARRIDRSRGPALFGDRDVHQIVAGDDQTIAGGEGRGEGGVDPHGPVTADEHELPLGEALDAFRSQPGHQITPPSTARRRAGPGRRSRWSGALPRPWPPTTDRR